MKILIVNDDSIHAPGIVKLARAAAAKVEEEKPLAPVQAPTDIGEIDEIFKIFSR